MRHLLNTLFVMSEDAYLFTENDDVVVRRGDDIVAKVPLRSLETILCFSYKGASPALLGRCAEFGVGVSFFSPRGRYYCSIFGQGSRNVLLRRTQYRLADDSVAKLSFARSFIMGKLYNARWVLERTKRDHALRVNVERLVAASSDLASLLTEVRRCDSMESLRGLEGTAAKEYFGVFDDLILRNKECFFFQGRSRRPPIDRINALLSFVYVILTNDCSAALQGVGLDPYVGFMHTDRPGRTSLSLDLVEEFRPVIADRFVLTLINTGVIKPSDFKETESGGVYLNDSGRKVVLTTWQKHKLETINHPFLKEKVAWGLVPYVQALLLARTIRGDLDVYLPFMWK